MFILTLIFSGLAFAGHWPKQDLGFTQAARFCKLSHYVPEVHIRCDTGEINLRLKIHPLRHPIGQKKVYDLIAQKYFPQLSFINCTSEDSLKCVYAENKLSSTASWGSATDQNCLASVKTQHLLFECESGFVQGPVVQSFAQAMVEAQKELGTFNLVHCGEMNDRGAYCEFSH